MGKRSDLNASDRRALVVAILKREEPVPVLARRTGWDQIFEAETLVAQALRAAESQVGDSERSSGLWRCGF